MEIVSSIFEVLGNVATEFGLLISSIFTSATSIFYDATSKELTVVGVLILIGVAVGLFMFAFKFIRGLIKMKG